jgi:hypothetical protein
MLKMINTKSTTVVIVAVLATVMLIGPTISGAGEVFAQKYKNWEDCRDDHSKNWCKKYFKHHHDDKDGGNSASQGIGQSQISKQNSQVVSGGDSVGSGNNFNFQNQENKGNNALAQSGGGDDDDGGNSASQGIGQSQSSSQNSQVVSGGDSVGSGNNFNFQNQENSGNNALAQQ